MIVACVPRNALTLEGSRDHRQIKRTARAERALQAKGTERNRGINAPTRQSAGIFSDMTRLTVGRPQTAQAACDCRHEFTRFRANVLGV